MRFRNTSFALVLGFVAGACSGSTSSSSSSQTGPNSSTADGGQQQQAVLNGGISSWTTTSNLPIPLNTPTSQSGAFLAGAGGGFVYFYAGGYIACDTVSDCQWTIAVARQNPDGTLGTWKTFQPLNTGFEFAPGVDPTLVILNGYVYVFGVRQQPIPQGAWAAGAVAKQNSDGTLGKWSFLPPLCTGCNPAPMATKFGVAVDGRIYAGEASAGVKVATPKADGTIDAWSDAGPSGLLPNIGGPSGSGEIVGAWNEFAYARVNTTSDVAYGKLDADGKIAAFADTTRSPGVNRLIVVDRFLYGLRSDTSTGSQKVVYSLLHDDGVAGNWLAANPPPQPVSQAAFLAMGGYLYILSGVTVSNMLLSTVYYAKLL
jgi:hypothetical protein